MQDSKIENVSSDRMEELEHQGGDIFERANSITIENANDLDYASTLLAGIKGLRKQASEIFDEPIAAAHAAHKKIIAAKKKIESPLIMAEGAIKFKVGGYHKELERIASEARRKEEQRLRKLEEERRLAEAVRLEDEGKHEEAEDVLGDPAELPAPMITTPPPPKTEGLGIAKVYTATVEDLPQFLRWVIDTKSYDVLTVNRTVLNKMARADKEEFRIPGCALHVDRNVRVR